MGKGECTDSAGPVVGIVDAIQATKVGQAVAKLRTCEDKSVVALSKEIVRTWRSKVDSQRVAAKKKDCEGIQECLTAAKLGEEADWTILSS